VIAKLPYSRFDACSALGQLIAEKKVRPLDGAELVERPRGNEDPKQLIAQLKTILEREPNNRKILKRLAGLYGEQGQKGESATCYKLLAISYLEGGELKEAQECLRRSLKLNPKDIGTWQKLWDVIRSQGDRARMAAFGREYAAHFKKLGLMEVARDHLTEMVHLFQDQPEFKLQLAEAHFALGERKECIQRLFEVARHFLRSNQLDEAEKVFARILKHDRGNQKARELYDKLHSGTLARRRARRRKLVRHAVVILLATASCCFLAYDLYVRRELALATRTVFADSLLENQRYGEAISRIEAIRRRHPFTLTAAYESRLLLETLQEKSEALVGPREGPAEPAEPAEDR
jgi:tetratricopeptide (TPR) repeat protein